LSAELQRFPKRTLRGARTIYRIHRRKKSAWWFSANGDGRFDPTGSGTGACYLAEDPLGAWLEVFRKALLLAEADVTGRELMTVALGRDLRLADLTSRRALAYGVTASLGAGEDYAASQRFAAHALAAGFDGIRYLVRHDPAQKLYGIALFGPPGAADPADGCWPHASGPIPGGVIARAEREFGYRVLPTP
jgi:RES domain-containing protein